MHSLLIIVTLVLSSVFSGSLRTIDNHADIPASAVYAQADFSGNSATDFKHSDIVTSANTLLSGENTGTASNFRLNGSSRRAQSSGKSSSRTIKAGKVIDKHTFCTYQIEIRQFASGIRSTGRYIHSICQLRL